MRAVETQALRHLLLACVFAGCSCVGGSNVSRDAGALLDGGVSDSGDASVLLDGGVGSDSGVFPDCSRFPTTPSHLPKATLDAWETRRFGPRLKALAFGNGTLVSVGELGALATSTDGGPWRFGSMGITTRDGGIPSFHSVVFDEQGFIAVGDAVAHSRDGLSWTFIDAQLPDRLGRLVALDGLVVSLSPVSNAISSDPRWPWRSSGLVSRDRGLTWTTGFLDSAWVSALTTVDGQYLAATIGADGDGGLFRSSDAGTWIPEVLPPGSQWPLSQLAWGAGIGCLLSERGEVLRHVDGGWSRQTPLGFAVQEMVFSDNHFVVAAKPSAGTIDGPALMASTDCSTWRVLAGDAGVPIGGLIAFGDRIAGVGFGGVDPTGVSAAPGPLFQARTSALEVIETRSGARTTIEPPGGEAFHALGLAGGFSGFVAPGEAGGVLTSPDGRAWSFAIRPANSVAGADIVTLAAAATLDGGWVVAGSARSRFGEGTTVIASSLRTTPFAERPWRSLLSNCGEYVSIPGLRRSSDGVEWSQPLTSMSAIAGATDGRVTVLVGDAVSTVESAQVQVTHAAAMNAAAWGNGLFVLVGRGSSGGSTVLRSTDGTTWTSSNLSGPELRALTFADHTFVAVGDEGTVWESVDGATWSRHSVGSRLRLIGVGFSQGRWAVLGVDGTILATP